MIVGRQAYVLVAIAMPYGTMATKVKHYDRAETCKILLVRDKDQSQRLGIEIYTRCR